jgi:hypothetical protein
VPCKADLTVFCDENPLLGTSPKTPNYPSSKVHKKVIDPVHPVGGQE